ncbi:Homeobox domain [Macleaya cordata]|uniref:Homeobox domain n=1 Tax=Macleaya cordata TaxID=56857 RepID=A0A200QE37_MACCD|nr:Homeobox domain [Macleaya cordata]
MATYYPTSSNQRDVTPNLYLRDPAPNSYPEAQGLAGNMMMYMNYSSSTGSYSDPLAGNSQSQQNCVDLPSVGASELGSSQQGILSNFVGSQTGDQSYSLWRDSRNEMLFMQPTGGPTNIQSINGATDDLVRSSVTEDTQMGLGTQLGILHGGQNLQGQGLSLSLSTHIPSAIPVPSFQYRQPNPGLTSFLNSHPSISGSGGGGSGSGSRDDESPQNKQLRNAEYLQPGFTGIHHDVIKGEALNNLLSAVGPKQMHSDPSPYGVPGIASTIANSKYLKVAQQLLDEVVNVHKALKQHEGVLKGSKETDEQLKDGAAVGMPSDPQEVTTTSAGELSPAERQDLQNKMTKLLSMLDEVDRRYKQYYHQMQIVVSSFDVIAGCGAAKPYTALALQTISRHFRCLRDAINDQIKATRKSLGEQDTAGNGKGGGISRLRFVDQQLRQQRALQQLGMMQQHAWRPQRGLPESSVTILRAWLFEHFLHPYPKDSDKIMLARQTGLTRSQVSNWFINARVRLWKPMVEEMYKEEFGETEMDSNSSSENLSKTVRDNTKASEDNKREELQQLVKSATTERCHPRQFHESKPDFIPDVEMSGPTAGASFQNGGHEDNTGYRGMKLSSGQRSHADDCSLLQDAFVQSDGNGSGRFMTANAAYQMAELARYGSGSGVSLTLGLQHCDGGGLSMSGGTHQNFVMRADDMYNAAAAAAAAASSLGSDTADYDCMDPGDRRSRFSSSHMLHDFVA